MSSLESKMFWFMSYMSALPRFKNHHQRILVSKLQRNSIVEIGYLLGLQHKWRVSYFHVKFVERHG